MDSFLYYIKLPKSKNNLANRRPPPTQIPSATNHLPLPVENAQLVFIGKLLSYLRTQESDATGIEEEVAHFMQGLSTPQLEQVRTGLKVT